MRDEEEIAFTWAVLQRQALNDFVSCNCRLVDEIVLPATKQQMSNFVDEQRGHLQLGGAPYQHM
jgi:hypothetical protein